MNKLAALRMEGLHFKISQLEGIIDNLRNINGQITTRTSELLLENKKLKISLSKILQRLEVVHNNHTNKKLENWILLQMYDKIYVELDNLFKNLDKPVVKEKFYQLQPF